MLNQANTEKKKKRLRAPTTRQEWVVAANNLAQFAVSTHPQVIPNSVLPNYYKYVTDFDRAICAASA